MLVERIKVMAHVSETAYMGALSSVIIRLAPTRVALWLYFKDYGRKIVHQRALADFAKVPLCCVTCSFE